MLEIERKKEAKKIKVTKTTKKKKKGKIEWNLIERKKETAIKKEKERKGNERQLRTI